MEVWKIRYNLFNSRIYITKQGHLSSRKKAVVKIFPPPNRNPPACYSILVPFILLIFSWRLVISARSFWKPCCLHQVVKIIRPLWTTRGTTQVTHGTKLVAFFRWLQYCIFILLVWCLFLEISSVFYWFDRIIIISSEYVAKIERNMES